MGHENENRNLTVFFNCSKYIGPSLVMNTPYPIPADHKSTWGWPRAVREVDRKELSVSALPPPVEVRRGGVWVLKGEVGPSILLQSEHTGGGDI